MRKHSPYIIILILSTALVLSLEKCSSVKNKNIANIAGLTDTVMYFKNKLGTQTAEIKMLQLNKEQLQHLILEKDRKLNLLSKDFSKINTIVKYKTLVQFDTLRITYKDTIPCVFKRSGEVKDDWYSFMYNSNQKGIIIDSFNTHTETTIINGFKRKWLLGNETVTTNITNSNPYLTVVQIKSTEVVVPEPWYKKWYVWLALGISTGFLSSQ